MKILEKNGFLVGLRDTGDQQHYLGLKISKRPSDKLFFKQFIPKGKIGKSLIDEELLAASVQKGIDKYNNERGTEFFVLEIEYVPFDSPSYDIYTIMSEAILSRGRHAE
ncbi:MAG: hypothetical protein P8098_17915 [Candidatus Thiodiazotropha sp.]